MAASMRKCTRCRNHYANSFLFYSAIKQKINSRNHNSVSSGKQPNSIEYCLNLVRKSDYENYLCSLLYPSTYRTSAFAIRALNVELAQVVILGKLGFTARCIRERRTPLTPLKALEVWLLANIFNKTCLACLDPGVTVHYEISPGSTLFTKVSVLVCRAEMVIQTLVQDVTTDKMRAIMRMQFWKDSIDHIFKGSPPHTPVAKEVARAVEKHKLSKVWMMRILQARANHIETDSFRTVEEIETYAENTVAALNYLLLQCAGIQNVTADHAASHLGRSLGLVTLLRSTPFHANRSRIYLPVELLLKHNVSEEDIRRGKTDQKVKDVIYDIACCAHQHLETARSFKKDIPKAAIPVLNNSVVCENYLKKLQLADFNVFDPSLQPRNNLLPLHLLKQKLRRTY